MNYYFPTYERCILVPLRSYWWDGEDKLKDDLQDGHVILFFYFIFVYQTFPSLFW